MPNQGLMSNKNTKHWNRKCLGPCFKMVDGFLYCTEFYSAMTEVLFPLCFQNSQLNANITDLQTLLKHKDDSSKAYRERTDTQVRTPGSCKPNITWQLHKSEWHDWFVPSDIRSGAKAGSRFWQDKEFGTDACRQWIIHRKTGTWCEFKS